MEYLFDDQSFTKSILYHWIVKTCYDLDSSIERTLKFVHRFEKNSLTGLQRRAHPYEQNGLAHWVSRFREETAELDAVRAEVHALKTQVVELVSYLGPYLVKIWKHHEFWTDLVNVARSSKSIVFALSRYVVEAK